MSKMPLLLALLVLSSRLATEPMCGTSPANDAAVRALHARQHARSRVEAQAAAEPVARDGAIYLQADERIAPGHHPFDLAGQSLLFEPRGATAFRVRREPLRYIEPAGAPVRDFQTTEATPWFAIAHDLPFSVHLFGRDVSRIWITAFNAIEFEEPPSEESVMQIDDVEAAARPRAIVSPLLLTNQRPKGLVYPQVFVDDTAGAVVVTWRSSAGAAFGYDVQAELRRDGSIAFSYKTVRAMTWGTPVVSGGSDVASAQRQLLASNDDPAGDVSLAASEQIKAMADVRKAEVFRVAGSDLYAVRLQLAAAVNVSLLNATQSLRYVATVAGQSAVLEIDHTGAITRVPFGGGRPARGGVSSRVSGNVVEFYGMQPRVAEATTFTARVLTYVLPLSRAVDASPAFEVAFDPAPRHVATDFSAVTDEERPLPLLEAFTLAPFDPYEVYERVQNAFALSDEKVDAVAMYQTFFTDVIFYAGAYSTPGNPQVDGIAPRNSQFSTLFAREPSLLHMNQLTYNYSATVETASKVMLHELAHRWLYYISIRENGEESRVLNPVSAHPAAYVHTPSAFPVYGDDESSVMGGGYFTPQSDGTFRARAANMGYSWTDLYLMGLATPQEVPPWFYLANTNLTKEYWPEDGALVAGEKRDVTIQQVLDVHGPRKPSAATAQRRFRVLFVLVTEPGADPTPEQIAKINEWRALLERNFSIATGGRGWVATELAVPAKTRAVR